MWSSILSNLTRFLLLLLVQVLVLNNIHLSGLFNPYLYPLFILLLPFETPRWFQLLLAFAMGMGVDLFSHTPGLHASALVLLAFLRQPVINLLKPADGYQSDRKPRIASMGFLWFLVYASLLVVAHHFFFFMVETFSFRQLLYVISKILMSSLLSLALMILLEYLFFERRDISRQ